MLKKLSMHMSGHYMVARFITDNYSQFRSWFDSLSKYQQLAVVFGTAILLRLLISPFFAHEDLYLTYGRSYDIAFNGAEITKFNQQIPHAVQAVNLQLYNLLFDHANLLPLPLSTMNVREVIDSGIIFGNGWLRLNLLWMKLPYIAFDIATAVTIYLLVRRHWLRAVSYYLFNPISIFAVYVFSRYESIPLFFLMLSLLLMYRKQNTWSALTFGLAITSRSSMLMVLPIYILTAGKTWLQKAQMAILSVLPYLLVLLFQANDSYTERSEVSWVVDGRHTNFIFANQIPLDVDVEIYPFLIGFTIIGFFGLRLWQQIGSSWRLSAAAMAMTFLWFFATSFYHPQYLAWVIPLLAILLTTNCAWRTLLWASLGATLLLPIMLLTWRQPILMGVFRPANEWLGTRNLAGVIDNYYPATKLANIARSGMSAMMGMLGLGIAIPHWDRVRRVLASD